MGLFASTRSGRIRDIVRRNGDATPFVSDAAFLVRGGLKTPVTLVGSERAVHVVEDHSNSAAVCDYHRIVRLDVAAAGSDYDVALVCYMGGTPTAERIRAGDPLAPSELAIYHLRLHETRHARELVHHILSRTPEDAFPASMRPRSVLLSAAG